MDVETKYVAMKSIRTDGGTQARVELNRDVFLEYRDLWLAKVEFEPVDLYHDGSVYWLADGFHRFHGAREANLLTILARVHQGTLRDAILKASSANQGHGLRRTNADKRRAVEMLMSDEEWCKWADNRIAQHVGVSHVLVADVRRQLEESSSSPAAKAAAEPRVGRDGKARKLPAKPAAVSAASAVVEQPAPAQDTERRVSPRNGKATVVHRPLPFDQKAIEKQFGAASRAVDDMARSVNLSQAPPHRKIQQLLSGAFSGIQEFASICERAFREEQP